MLAVSAAHARHHSVTTTSQQSSIEMYHTNQCVALFNRKLSAPLRNLDRDPLWGTAALLGLMAMAAFDALTPETILAPATTSSGRFGMVSINTGEESGLGLD